MTNINTENKKRSNELLERAIRDMWFDYVAHKGYMVNDERAAELIAVLLPWIKVSSLPIGRANQWLQMTRSELLRSDCPFAWELSERLSEFGPGLTALDVINLQMNTAKKFYSVRSVIRTERQHKQSVKAANKAVLATIVSAVIVNAAEKAAAKKVAVKAAKQAAKAAHEAAMAAKKARKFEARLRRRLHKGNRIVLSSSLTELLNNKKAAKVKTALTRLSAVKTAAAANVATVSAPKQGAFSLDIQLFAVEGPTSEGGGDTTIRNVFNDELKLVKGDRESAVENTVLKLLGIKALTGPVTAAGTRIAAMTNGINDKATRFIVQAAALTIMREDIEGGIMNKDAAKAQSNTLRLDKKLVVDEQITSVLTSRFGEYGKPMAQMLQGWVNSLHLRPDKNGRRGALSNFFRANSISEYAVLSKVWTAKWSTIANRTLDAFKISDELVKQQKLVAAVGDRVLDKSRTLGGFKRRIEVLKGAYGLDDIAASEAADDAEDEAANSDDISSAAIEKALEMAAEQHGTPTVDAEALAARLNSITAKLQEFAAFTAKADANIVHLLKDEQEYGIIPAFGIIGDSIDLIPEKDERGQIVHMEYQVISGLFAILNAANLAVSALQGAKNVRDTLKSIWRPHVGHNIGSVAFVMDETLRASLYEKGYDVLVDYFIKDVFNDGWDILSLASPNKALGIWSPRAGFERVAHTDGTVTLRAVGKTAPVCRYELAANPMAAYTDPKRATTTMWSLTPEVTDGKQHVRIDVLLGKQLIEGQDADGIEPLTVFLPTGIVENIYPQMKSTNSYFTTSEDAYAMLASYRKTLTLDGAAIEQHIIKLSQARNKGLVTSTFNASISVDGVSDQQIEVIARGDGSRHNKLATQWLSAVRLAAKMLGFKSIRLVSGLEPQVGEAILKECERKTGFNPLDATIRFTGRDGKSVVVEHVVAGLYHVLVDVSQDYDAYFSSRTYGATYFSAKLVANLTMPSAAKKAEAAFEDSADRDRYLKALSNFRGISKEMNGVVAMDIERLLSYMPQTREGRRLAEGVRFVRYFSNFDKSSRKFVDFSFKLGSRKLAVDPSMEDVTMLEQLLNFNNKGKQLDEEAAKAIAVNFKGFYYLPVIVLPDGKVGVVAITIPDVTPIGQYDGADGNVKYVAGEILSLVKGLMATLTASEDNFERDKHIIEAVEKLSGHLKGAAYKAVKARRALPGIRGRVATLREDVDGFVLGWKQFIRLAQEPSALRLWGVPEEQIVGLVGEAISIHDMSEAIAFKAKLEAAVGHPLYLIAQRSPALNFLGSGKLIGLVAMPIIGIPHSQGKKMAADDDGDPANVVPADRQFNSIFDKLGEGANTARR